MGQRGAASWGPLSPDLQDMSPVVLTCDAPDELFDSYKLVLNVPLSDSKRMRVFCTRGKWPGGASSLPTPGSASQIISFFSYPHLSILPSSFCNSHYHLKAATASRQDPWTKEEGPKLDPFYRGEN